MKGKKPSKEQQELLDEQQRVVKKIGERITELRKKTHSSYEKFAFENDIDRSQYGNYERGQDMQITSLVKVCRALGISLAEFFKVFD